MNAVLQGAQTCYYPPRSAISAMCPAMQGRSLDLQMYVFGCARQHHEVFHACLCVSFRPCRLQCLHCCWLVYLSPFERTPFLPMLVCAQIVNSATGDIKDGCCTSDDDSFASRSSCPSVRASICGITSMTNAMELDSVVSRSRHLGIKCRQARCVSTSDVPIISRIILVCHFFVFHILWNFNTCCRCLLCRST